MFCISLSTYINQGKREKYDDEKKEDVIFPTDGKKQMETLTTTTMQHSVV